MSTLYPHGGVAAEPTEPLAEPGTCFGLLQQITILGRQIRRVLTQRLAQLDLNDSELLLLWVCAGGGSEGTAQNRLAASMALSTAQVSGLVERISGRGLIRECPSSTDRRRRLWQLTAAGRDKLDSVLASLAPLTNAWDGQFDIRAQAELAGLLERVGQIATAVSSDNGRCEPLRVFPHRDHVAGHGEAGVEEAP